MDMEVGQMREYTTESMAEVALDLSEKKRIRVLHVDDEPSFLKVAKQCLETEDQLQVDTASSVEEAMKKMKNRVYDVIVSDYQMPGKDGLEFLKELRHRGDTIPFIMFTGKGREEVAINALNLGADQYLNKTGNPETVYGELAHAIRQASDRKSAQERMKESEERYRNLFETAPDAIVTLNMKGVVTSCNAATAKLTGYSKDVIVGRHFSELGFLHQKDVPKYQAAFAVIMRGKVSKPMQVSWHRKDGTVCFSELHFGLVKKDDKTIGIQAIAIDVTEREKAEEELRNNEEKFRNLAEQSPNMIFINRKGKVVYANEKAGEAMGYRIEEFYSPSFNFLDLIAPESKELVRSSFSVHTKGEDVKPYEFKLITKEGRIIDAMLASKLITYEGEPAILGTAIDITARKKAEDAWRASEEEFRTLFEEAMDAIFVADAETGVLIDCNRAATELVDRSKSELIGKHQRILHPPQEIIEGGFSKTFQQHVKEKGGQVLETQIVTKRGEIKEVAIKASLIELGGKKVLQGIFRDVTEDKRAKGALRKSSEEARSLLEFQNKVIDTAIFWINLLDREGNVTLWNRAAELISGYSREEVVGHKRIWEWLYPDPEYRARIFAHQKKTIEDKESAFQDFETVMRCKDGMTKTISWYSNNIVDEKGEPVGSIAMGTDVTELRDAEEELKAAMERLGIMNEKLRVVGGLTRHDVRNKLSVITGNAYLAKKELVGNSKVQDYLREMEVAVRQVVRIFDFAKAYEMLGVEELVDVDVEKTVGEAVSLFSDLKGVKVANDCHGLSVLADSLLRQLFYNLVDNSLKYGQKTTRIRIHYEEASQDELKLVYEDDGVGIPAAEKPKLFKEGYSTGGSTGYGLYLIGKIVEVYGWTIRETGTSGKGAEFTMIIPKKGLKGKENYQIR